MTTNCDHPKDGDHPRDDDHPIDHIQPPDSNPYPPGHSGNHPGCPDNLYWLLINVSSTYTHTHTHTQTHKISTLGRPLPSGQRP